MRIKSYKLFIGILCVCLLAGAGKSYAFLDGFAFSLSGGYSWMKIGDFNDVIEDSEQYWTDVLTPFGVTKEGEWKIIGGTINLQFDAILRFMNNFGFGISSGYQESRNNGEIKWIDPNAADIRYVMDPKAYTVPLKASLYVFIPMQRIYLTAHGGAGLYFGKISYKTDLYFSVVNGTADSTAFGYHGGISLELPFADNLYFMIQGQYQSVKYTDFSGNVTITDSEGRETTDGKLWLLEQEIGGKTYTNMIFSPQQPADPSILSAREFELDMSGFSIRAGIRIRF
jgi:hypothetical protein